MSSRPRGRRRLRGLLLAVTLLIAGTIGALALRSGPADVSDSGVSFEKAPPTVPRSASPPRRTGAHSHPFDDGFSWPVYGLTKARTRYLPTAQPLRPPFVRRWALTGRILLEFSPVLCRRSLYLLKNNGALYSVSRQTGRVQWKRKLGGLAASSPACGHGTVYAVLLTRGKGTKGGRIVALSTRGGRTRWSRKLPSRAESSPLLSDGRLYFGTEDGTVYALRASNGAVRWRFRAGGAVKAGLAEADGKLFFGAYGGKMHAIRKRDGAKVWTKDAGGGVLGVGRGNFYATPAVAYGRVYIGSTNGSVLSFSGRDGQLAWRHRTGGFVYSSPAVSPVNGGTVFAGSYDGKLYAFDARSGKVRWARNSGGKISGGPTVVGDLVFYSNLTRRSTAAVGAANGRLVWKVQRGGFNPVISDGRRIYLNGYSSLFMLSTPRQARADRRARAAYRRARRAHVSPKRSRPHRRRAPRRHREPPRGRRRNHDTAAHRAKLHGHRHTGHGDPPRCHRHRHTIRRGKRTIVYRHTHCHRHAPRARR
jgi:outer membrane protein assembly factor BamB